MYPIVYEIPKKIVRLLFDDRGFPYRPKLKDIKHALSFFPQDTKVLGFSQALNGYFTFILESEKFDESWSWEPPIYTVRNLIFKIQLPSYEK